MDEPSYRSWWALHLRVARGERLDARERAIYDAGLERLHGEESFEATASRLRELRAHLQTLQAEQSRLVARQEPLDAEIAALEALLDEARLEPGGTKE